MEYKKIQFPLPTVISEPNVRRHHYCHSPTEVSLRQSDSQTVSSSLVGIFPVLEYSCLKAFLSSSVSGSSGYRP